MPLQQMMTSTKSSARQAVRRNSRRLARVVEDFQHDRQAARKARALKDMTVRFDNLWRQSFPYVMPLHQAPTDGGDYRDFHAFVGFLPPLRRPNTLKYLAGPEIGGGNFLSDTSPEDKAAELRALPAVHYREQ